MPGTGDTLLDDILAEYEYDTNNWRPIRREAATDMQYVNGNPWDSDDEKIREDRPTVAPEEMSQYRNQVINGLMANPRGAKFAPRGSGASDRGAEFYQNKWREIEYRSHGSQQYVVTADNVLQRSYGFLRLRTKYSSPRSANQEIWLEAFADPDMVLPDTDGMQLDGSDWKRCVVEEWLHENEFKRLYKDASTISFSTEGRTEQQKKWIAGKRVRRAECWRIVTRPRTLVLVQPPAPAMGAQPGQMLNLQQAAPPRPLQVFEDELPKLQAKFGGRVQVIRQLRAVDYPTVKCYMTNGVEILSESDWAGQYIPIVPCYGKVLYVPEGGDKGGDSEKVILSMTRFGRAPWKSYCYACSQELEVLAIVPKTSMLAIEGQFEGHETEIEESMYKPKAFVYYKKTTEATGDAALERPEPINYPVGQHLQALELVKEGFRRAIQAAMGSNFLPTNAQRINDKSGAALDKIDEVASQGTYHFVYAYESMIRRAGIIGEDLMDKIYDYQGETAVRTADDKDLIVAINDPANQEAYATAGEYGVTVSTAPSTDSERQAAEAFTDALLKQINMIAEVAGPKIAAAMLAISIRMRAAQLGPMAGKLADLIEPPEFKEQDGKPPDPRLVSAQAQIQQLTEQLKQAGFIIQSEQVKGETKFRIEQMKVEATSADKAADREVKLAVAAISAKTDRMALLLEESRLVGVRMLDAAEALRGEIHAARESAHERIHDRVERAKDRAHAAIAGEVAHDQALELVAANAAAQPPDQGATA